MPTKRRASLLLIATLLCLPTSTLADQPVPSAEALRHGHDGLSLYQQGRWEDALSRFDQATRAMYSPVFELYMARCERNLSRLREAARRLEGVLARPVATDAPLAWSNAVRDAQAELEALRGTIPSIRILGAEVATVTADDTPVELDRLIDLNPGPHTLRARARDGRLVTRSVSLAAGDQGISVTIVFPPLPQPIITTAPSAQRSGTSRRSVAHRDPWKTAAWITGGAAVACAILGTVTGLIAQSRTTSIRAKCQGSHCPPDLEDDLERARAFANVSTAAFGVAAVDASFSLSFTLFPLSSDPHASAKSRRK